MKKTFLYCLTALAAVSQANAAKTVSYPEKSPLVSFSIPDDWDAQVKSGSLFVVSPDGGDVIVEVQTLEAEMDDDAAAFEEAKGTVNEDFKNLTLTKSDPTVTNGLGFTMLGGEGADDNGPAHINMALIKHPKAKNQILFSLIAAKENATKHGAACGAMLNSISAATVGKTRTAQTFSYPDKDKPDFAVDFPAEWKMEENDGGVYVESPDKLIAINVLLIDKTELDQAVETLKKSVGERFKEIVWNQGNDPEVNKDDDLGLTATFHNAVASDGDGTEKYAVNLVSYVRKNGDKFLILLCQNPLRALDKHGDALQAVILSIKVR